MPITLLTGRGVVEVAGPDRVGFLQGLVSNDVAAAGPGRAVWAALLTPQGKWLADFFILAEAERLLLDAEAAQVPLLVQRLSRFRLRAKVTLRDASADFTVLAGWGGAVPPPGTLSAPDPRLPEAGWRALVAQQVAADATEADYDLHRLRLGLPDGSRDLEPEKSVLLEGGFDELGGVSWTKGCYMGQELTARTKYRGLLKRRIIPVRVEGGLPPAGTPVLRDGVEVGVMRSARDGHGLALLRLDAVAPGVTLTADGALLTPFVPGWMKLPVPAAAE
ncbi:folate-binding protein YgfZ [Roseomonas frigidaquae]|uniref:Folate-binding protein YgfZ n=1 Tax=Falsiroseomonas frigidaquae TaxID=487318 RepID=A0ABX1EY30_9PROT|nr:folate-binding protein YgfZ [Falsiroseomonas frigidaquae]NKE45006.1 folate-binding protein YgfZ [Falsiroseomonas frigidaquae]